VRDEIASILKTLSPKEAGCASGGARPAPARSAGGGRSGPGAVGKPSQVPPFGAKHGITSSRTVKTAISIDDRLLQEADRTARLMGLSRSRLFARAIGEFLQRQRREQMLHRLNEVYADGMEPAEKRLLAGMKARVRPAVKERW